jgi:hypothetical protein
MGTVLSSDSLKLTFFGRLFFTAACQENKAAKIIDAWPETL